MICAGEFAMADDAFALSPISARAARPSEQDYDAISEAFMETSRGRWFLGEYAKRNRNADTSMVLDAVARIEESLAAQSLAAQSLAAQSLAAQQYQPADSGLAEALAAIRGAVDEARAAAAASLENLSPEQSLAPVRKGARVIREIAWRLREIGADGRICDLIDSQVDVIEGGCGQISSIDPLSALGAAFDLIEGRIAKFGDDDVAAPEATGEAMPAAAAVPPDETPAAAEATIEAATATADATDNVEVTMAVPASSAESTAAAAEALEMAETSEIAETLRTAETSKATVAEVALEAMPQVLQEALHEALGAAPEVAEAPEAADAHDDAVLAMVALEMAAPDSSDTGDTFEKDTDEIYIEKSAVADLEIIPARAEPQNPEPPAPEPIAVPASPPAIQLLVQPSVQPLVQPPFETTSLEPSPEPSSEPSLGSSLVASGIVRRPKASVSDPLAPIRRMSQAEKIAFFS
jgi:hypothetical protein